MLEEDLIVRAKIGEYFILNPLEEMTHYNSIVVNPMILKQIKAEEHGTKTNFVMSYLKNTEENVAIFSSRKEAILQLEKLIKKELPKK